MIKTSDTRIRSETKLWSKRVKKLARKIATQEKTHKTIQSDMDDIDKKLSKNKDYNQLQESYKKQAEQVKQLEDKLKKSKSKSTKKKIADNLNDLKKKKAQSSSKMRDIAKTRGFSILHSKRVRKQTTLKNSDKLLKDLRHQKSHAKAKYNEYKQLGFAKHHQEVQKKNSPKIQSQLKKYNGKFTTLYRTDMMNSTVFPLVEISPSETDTNNVDSTAIEGQSVPQTNYVSRDSKELSGTYNLYGKNLRDCDNKFDKLQKWSAKYEFTINGFSRWRHAYITSIAKSTDVTMNKNAIALSISFVYAKQAKIQFAKKKGGKKTKAGTKKKKGTSNSDKRYIKIKSGMTYAQIAKKTHQPLKTVMKMNKFSANKLPIGKKVRYK